MKRLLSTVGLSLVVLSGNVLADDYASTCESWGYKTNLKDCTVGLPLICPYSNNNASQQPKCLCIDKSCRGFSLLESDLDEIASDGRKVRDHIESLETCESGIGADKVTYYRIKKCKEGSLYQIQNTKPTCDVGCPTEKYPYSEHPGDLAGVVESCIDERGTWFGYVSCNEGWVKGGTAGHECIFNDCNVRNYPYSYDPNTIQQRGTTAYCKVGGNNYYQYTSCDSGFTPKGSVCQASCQLQNCSVKDTSKGYNEWACSVANKLNCQVGDAVYLSGNYVGVIGYQADGSGETMILATAPNNSITPFASLPFSNMLANDRSYSLTGTGHANTLQVLKIKAENEGFEYPAVEACHNYTSPLCNHNMCASGEWYLSTHSEISKTYASRNILYNVTSQGVFTGSYMQSSYDNSSVYHTCFSYANGQSWSMGRTSNYTTVPILSYTQR